MRVFDTSFIIDLSNSDPGAIKLANAIDEDASVAAISVISVQEYVLGIQMKYLNDKELLAAKLQAAEKVLSAFMILPITQEIAMQSAKIQAVLTKSGKIIGINDIYIAATALANQAPVVTRNVSEFEHVEGLTVQRY